MEPVFIPVLEGEIVKRKTYEQIKATGMHLKQDPLPWSSRRRRRILAERRDKRAAMERWRHTKKSWAKFCAILSTDTVGSYQQLAKLSRRIAGCSENNHNVIARSGR